ncbi:hypothetical protein CAPTEDRAFT_114107 [Capitella teleta]|uniref:Alpha-1,4-N-acetylglucosaminyltransferase n=1 Tax=Capitella teleta TaxID=283909 RepID=R7T4F5_CAPTE|nr:hypothetical protein CAPTEDRAFT_114107 [Capitella teleta]|eukprot:ELT87788.1 hypothetical protein CAPTEDRAFT_114107 [Capitella teleta]
MFSWSRVKVLPRNWKIASKHCETRNSFNKYIKWTEATFLPFLQTEYPWFVDVYKAYPYDVQRVDAAKYFIMYHFGGVYVDMDMNCRRNIWYFTSKISHNHSVALVRTEPMGFATDFMASKPRQPFFHHVIVRLYETSQRNYIFPYLTVLFATGPMFLTSCVNSYKGNNSENNFHVI